MFQLDNPRLMHVLYALPIFEGVREVQEVAHVIAGKVIMYPDAVAGAAYAGCALATFGLVLAIGTEWSVRREEDYQRAIRLSGKPTVEDKLRAAREAVPEPEPLPNGLRPIIRVDGKPRASYAYTAQAVKLNKEREFYVILWRWHESKRPINLTEAYWLKQRKQFKNRNEFVNVKARGEADGIFYRLNANKNSGHDVDDWDKVEKIARGGPLPY